MKKAVFLIIVYISFAVSCSSIPRSIKNAFTYCYEDRYTGIDTLINIEGYYSLHPILIFYDNGLVVSPIARDAERLLHNGFSFLQEETKNTKTINSRYSIFNFIECGSYKICVDTIKIQLIHKSSSINDYWRGHEYWYKIIDRNTLLFVGSYLITTNQKEKDFIEKNYPFTGGSKSTFVPVPTLPQPDYFWILKEKWFWCNDQDWKTNKNRLM